MIFSKRWHGIKGETVGEGKYAMSVVRVQTSKDGAWNALTEKELEQLIAEHNAIVYENEKEPRPCAKPLVVSVPDPDKKMKAPSFVKLTKKKLGIKSAKKKGKKK